MFSRARNSASGVAGMIDPDPAQLAGSVPVLRIQENERIPLQNRRRMRAPARSKRAAYGSAGSSVVIRRNSDWGCVIDRPRTTIPPRGSATGHTTRLEVPVAAITDAFLSRATSSWLS